MVPSARSITVTPFSWPDGSSGSSVCSMVADLYQDGAGRTPGCSPAWHSDTKPAPIGSTDRERHPPILWITLWTSAGRVVLHRGFPGSAPGCLESVQRLSH